MHPLLQAFITPARCRVSRRELATMERLKAFEVEAPLRREDSACKSIRGYWAGEGPSVLLLHGWGGRAAQFASFVDPLLRAGLKVVAFDAAAHGESGGRRTSVFEFVDSLRKVQELHGEFHALVGHSLGGASVCMAVADGFITARRLVLIAPTPRLMDETSKFVQRRDLSSRDLATLRQSLEQHFGADLWQRTCLASLAASVPCETLLLHDELDPEVPHSESEAVVRGLPLGQLVSTRGLGHLAPLRTATVVERVLRFMTS